MSFSLVATVVEVIVRILSTIGLPGLFALMVVESFGLPPVPSEVILPFSGFLIAEGTFSWSGAILAALAGGLLGAYAAYAVGRWGRERITGIGLGAFRLEASHLERMDRFFRRRGESTVAIARLLPVVRSYISYPAGTARMEPVRFGVYTVVGTTPFTVGLLYAGYVLRSHWSALTSTFQYADDVALALLAAGLVYLGLLIAGVLEAGWPPRRRQRPEAPARSSSTTAGPASPPGAG